MNWRWEVCASWFRHKPKKKPMISFDANPGTSLPHQVNIAPIADHPTWHSYIRGLVCL
jgi:hypothetical protein